MLNKQTEKSCLIYFFKKKNKTRCKICDSCLDCIKMPAFWFVYSTEKSFFFVIPARWFGSHGLLYEAQMRSLVTFPLASQL